MNIERIRSKYQQIFEESQSESSEGEFTEIKTHIDNCVGKRILTQCSNINPSNIENNALKIQEKLNQALANLSKKEQQVKAINIRFQNIRQQNLSFSQEIEKLNEKIQQHQKSIAEKNDTIKSLQIKLSSKDLKIESHVVDKQLLQQQINFYKQEVQSYKNQMKSQKKQFVTICKEIENLDLLKNQNDRLKNDIVRLGQILQQSERFKNIPRLVHNCSYLGKPLKQVDNWYPQDLIAQTQHFLKKQQIACGNKTFLNNLIKFIDRQIKRNVKETHMKIRRLQTQRKRSQQRKYNQLFCMHEITASNCSRSRLANSLCHNKQTNFYSTTEPKKNTQSFIYDKLQRSLAAHEFTKSKKVYIQLFEQFKKAMTEILNEKTIKRKKIAKLVAWICESSIDLFNSFTTVQHQHLQKFKTQQ